MLKKIESYLGAKLKIDTSYVMRGGFWLLLGHVFSMAAILATSYFFANFLDEHTYGVYRYLITVGVILSAFSLTGLAASVTQAAAKDLSGFFHISLRLSAKYGLVVTVLSTAGAVYYLGQGNNTLGFGLIMIAVLQPLMNTGGLISAYFIGKQQFKQNTQAHFFKTLFTSFATVLSILFSGDVVVMLATYFLSNIIANYLTRIVANVPTSQIDISDEKKFVSYAKHTSVQNIFATIASQLDKILVFQNLGAAQLAIYAFATALPDQYKGITKTIEMLLIPRFSRHGGKNIRARLISKTIIYFIFLTLCLVIYMLAAPLIFKILYPQYDDAVLLSQIYVIGIVFGIASLPLSALKTEHENKKLHFFNISASIFQVTSILILLPLYGLLGVIIARVAHRFFTCVSAFYLFLKKP